MVSEQAVGKIVDMPWHGGVLAQLRDAQRDGRLAQAFLLSGTARSGVEQLAMEIVRWRLCQRGGERPCGTCPTCRQVEAGAHPGLHVLRVPEGKRDIPVDDVRELAEKMAMSSGSAAGSIAVIDPADAMNSHGINGLLKSIEEPSPGSLFLLVTMRPSVLPATLRSRCQRVRVPLPSREEAMAWLARTAPQASVAEREQALGAVGDAPLRALEILTKGELEHYRRWAQLWKAVRTGRQSPISAAASVRAPGEGKSLSKDTALQFSGWLARQLHAELRARLVKAERGRARRLGSVLRDVVQAAEDLERHNASPQLTVDSLLLRASDFISVEETVA